MLTTERIAQQVGRLPEPLQREVLDFVEFLREKHHVVEGNEESDSLLSLQGGLEHSVTFAADEVKIQEQLRDEWN
ncbi:MULTISPECIES: DUF2281 domain-containing protein [Halomonadaceae]|uniref:DUF2281 domain-containing protein n=1 Tax=Billgrantia gudaonensis TaxID=376427 RepID=A0A1G8R054_9GAMM|nr:MULTISPECIES: DUF2281 domain-containing protein [Halomonas]SDJ10317.1 Protein of unknown function [Halomonas gudaonensis]